MHYIAKKNNILIYQLWLLTSKEDINAEAKALIKIMNNNLYIVMYHYTRDLSHSRYPNIKGIDLQQFKSQIKFLHNNFNIIRMEDVIESINRGVELPQNALLLTFDDGYVDNYLYAFPILEQFNIQGSFFIPGKTFTTHALLDVNKIHYILASANIDELVMDVKKALDYYRGTEFQYEDTISLYDKYAIENRFDNKDTIFVKRILQTVLPERLRNIISSELFKKYLGITEEQLAYELYLTEDQIRLMKKQGMFIGLHGFDHYWLGNLGKLEMIKDIKLALDALEEFIDRKCWVINYPYGSFNSEVISYVKSEGACIGMTTEVGVARLGIDDNMKLPRLDCNDFPPKSNRYIDF